MAQNFWFRLSSILQIIVFSFFALESLPTDAIAEQGEGCAGDQVSGLVFRDYNSNGIQDFLEPGVQGINVGVTDSIGAVLAATSTGVDGSYFLAPGSGQALRVEFSGIPNYLYAGVSGPNANTSVVFLADGGNCAVDLALSNPGQYCDPSPRLATTEYGGVTYPASDPVLVDFPYESGITTVNKNDGVTEPAATTRATSAQLGPVRGLAYHRETDTILAAAFVKRHVAFPGGPDDTAPGKIYAVKRDGSSPVLFFSASAGTDPHNYADLNTDFPVWEPVGKSGWADIDLSEDEKTLYAVNLFDRQVYSIPVSVVADTLVAGSPTKISLASIGASCSNDDWAPGGIKVSDGLVYLTVTCTAQTSGLSSDLKGIVAAYNPGTAAFTTVATFNLDYPRDVASRQGAIEIPGNWLPWVPVLTTLPFHPFGQDGYPQPHLMDIEFDEHNNMIVGISDRAGDQLGNINAGNGISAGVAAGDTLRLVPSGSTWILNAGDDDFYSSEKYDRPNDPNGVPVHTELSLGFLASILGRNEIVANCYNPAPLNSGIYDSTGTTLLYPFSYRAGGVIMMSNVDGLRTRSYQLFGVTDPGTFGKAAGIGDIEPICAPAPVEIGNRVWRDLNSNCVQDAGEPPIAGVTVQLVLASTKAVVATAVTNAYGEYYFNSLPDDGDDSNNVAGGVQIGETYEIRVGLSQPNLSGLTVVSGACGGDNATNSDAVAISGQAVVSVPPRSAGQNDHAFDIGFVSQVIDEYKILVGDYVWFDLNRNGVQEPGETPKVGVTVSLIDTDTDLTIATTFTNASGLYFFSEANGVIPNHKYKVTLNNPADFGPGGALQNMSLTIANQGDDTLDSDAALDGGFPSITFISPGKNGEDLSFDFGFIVEPSFEDLKEKNGVLDNGASILRNAALGAVSVRQSGAKSASKKCSKITSQSVKSLKAKINNAYTRVWGNIWGKLPEKSYSVSVNGVQTFCSLNDVSGAIATVESGLQEIASIGNSALSKCDSKWTRTKQQKTRIRSALKTGVEAVNAYPKLVGGLCE